MKNVPLKPYNSPKRFYVLVEAHSHDGYHTRHRVGFADTVEEALQLVNKDRAAMAETFGFFTPWRGTRNYRMFKAEAWSEVTDELSTAIARADIAEDR